jgi:hypothetical protein
MTDTDRKQKMISLRLSDEEYEDLKMHYRAHGVRNISELARLALHRIVAEGAEPQIGFEARLSEVEERLRQLESQVSLLVDSEKGTAKTCNS